MILGDVDWQYVDIEEMIQDKDKYIGLDSTAPSTQYDHDIYMQHAGGLSVANNQYVISFEAKGKIDIDNFEDLIITRE